MTSYDFTPKTFGEFLKINNLSLENGILAVTTEYLKLKEGKNGN
jgi:hypothetical protein